MLKPRTLRPSRSLSDGHMTPWRHPTNVYARQTAHLNRAGVLRRLGFIGLMIFGFGLLCCGCTSAASTEEPAETEEQVPEGPIAPSFEPIVMPNANVRGGARDPVRDRRPVDEKEAGWKEKLDLASHYVAAGYDDEALQVINNALQGEPPAAWANRLRHLKTTLRMRKAQVELLRVEARPVRDYVTFGNPVDFKIRIRNVSSEDVVLLAPQVASTGVAAVSPSAITLEIVRRDRDVFATTLKRKWTQTLFLQEPGGGPIRIAAGDVHEADARIPVGDAGRGISGLRVLEVSGTLRPTRMRVGDDERSVRLPVRPGKVVVVPAGYEPLAAEPLRSMRRALQTVAPIHLLVATEFVGRGSDAAAMQILADALAEGHASLRRAALAAVSLVRERSVGRPLLPLAQPLMEALERSEKFGGAGSEPVMQGLQTLTGAGMAPDPRIWRDWWRREREGQRVVTAFEKP